MASILNRSLIKVTGDDVSKFLQNLLTNDIYSNHATYSMMLSPQGRFLFDIFTIKNQEGFLLDVSESTKDILLKKLNLYKINTKVTIESLDSKIYYSRSLPEAMLYYKDPRFDALGYRFIASNNLPNDNAYLEDKYNYTIPDGEIDLLYDKAMPQEYGAEEMHAISFTKGCYVGQEMISRTKYQGQIRKKIYKLNSEQNLDNIKHSTEITSNGKKIGIFCSGYGKQGIALIREENIIEDAICNIDDILVEMKVAEWYNN